MKYIKLFEGIKYHKSYLEQIVNNFSKNYIDDFEYKTKVNHCDVFIYHFIDFIEEDYNITDYDIYLLSSYKGNPYNMDSSYVNRKKEDIYHVMIKIGDYFVDLTPQQINNSYNDFEIFKESDVKNNWDEIMIIPDKKELLKNCKGRIHLF